MTKKSAQHLANMKVKQIVVNRFDYSKEAIEKYGSTLIKRELFHARKEVKIKFNSLSNSWEAIHQESGILK